MDQENVLFIHNEILFSHKEEWNLTFAGELEDTILFEVSQVQRAKSFMFSVIWNIDLIQIQQCSKKQITLRKVHIWEQYDKRRKLRRWIWLMFSLYKNEYRIFKLVETTVRRGLEQKEGKQRWTKPSYNTHKHGRASGKLPV
jgi:hypothetical protein